MDLEELLAQAQKALQSGIRPDAVDSVVSARTQGRIRSVAELKVAAGKPAELSNAPPRTPKGVQQALSVIRQGMFIPGLSDEVQAAVRHPIDAIRHLIPGGSTGPAYEAALAEERASIAAGREQPGAVASELVGAGLTAQYLPLGPVRGLKGVIGGVAAGAGYGAAGGAASAEEGERVEGAMEGGKMGGLFGLGAGIAVPAVRAGLSRAADLIPGIRPATRIPEGAELRLSGGGGGIASHEDRALEKILGSLKADDVSLDALEAAAGRARGPVAVIDLAGDNMRGLARGARSVQGTRAKNIVGETLRRRTAGQEERITSTALRETGLGSRVNPFEASDEIIRRMESEAESAYGAIRDRVITDPDVLGLLGEDDFRQAYSIAQRIRNREIAAARLAGETPPPPLPDLGTADTQELTLGVLDQVKRGLDDVLYRAKQPQGLGKAEQGALKRLRSRFVERLDELVPEYADARSAYAGDVALLDALEEGQRLFDMHPDEAARIVADLGESERLMWRRGALEGLMRRVESTAESHNLTSRRPFNENTLDRKRMRMLFDSDEAFERFRDAIREEAQMAISQRYITGGSNTVDKLMEMADIAGVDLGDVIHAASGNPTGLMAKGASALGRRVVEGHTAETAEQLMPRLLAGADGDRAALQQLIRDLSATEKRLLEEELRGRSVVGATAAQLGLFGD